MIIGMLQIAVKRRKRMEGRRIGRMGLSIHASSKPSILVFSLLERCGYRQTVESAKTKVFRRPCAKAAARCNSCPATVLAAW
jgi:hypothetical protein